MVRIASWGQGGSSNSYPTNKNYNLPTQPQRKFIFWGHGLRSFQGQHALHMTLKSPWSLVHDTSVRFSRLSDSVVVVFFGGWGARIYGDTLPETHSLHLKVGGWFRWISFWGPAYFQGLLLLVSGSVDDRKFELMLFLGIISIISTSNETTFPVRWTPCKLPKSIIWYDSLYIYHVYVHLYMLQIYNFRNLIYNFRNLIMKPNTFFRNISHPHFSINFTTALKGSAVPTANLQE